MAMKKRTTIADVARVADVSMMTVSRAMSNKSGVSEEDALEALWEQDIGGAILCSLRLPPERLISKIEQLPAVVLINRELESALPHVVMINVNDQHGDISSSSYLIEPELVLRESG